MAFFIVAALRSFSKFVVLTGASMQLHSRIAPTPSGYLHAGNALNFVLTWLLVRSTNGTLRLRIDDLDAPRMQPQFLADVFETLNWLQVDWDLGPQTPDEHTNSYSQSARIEHYQTRITKLEETGLVFACKCSRSRIGAGQYPGTCIPLQLAYNTPDTALRIQTPADSVIEFNDEIKGKVAVDLYHSMRHFIIRRRDGIPAYQVASLADDVDYGINTLVRGEDLLPSTAAQLYLAKLAGLDSLIQSKFYHHALIKGVNGQKLSKSAGSQSLQWWRAQNAHPEKFYRYLSSLMGFQQPATSLSEMLQQFKEDSSPVLRCLGA